MSPFCNGIYNIDLTDANGCQGYVNPGASFTAVVGSDVQVSVPGVFPLIPTASCFNTADAMAGVLGGANPLLNYTWESSNSGAPSGLVLADYLTQYASNQNYTELVKKVIKYNIRGEYDI